MSSVKDQIAEWRRTGETLRAQLETRRQELCAELADVEGALAELPQSGASQPVNSHRPNGAHSAAPTTPATRLTGSVPEMVLAVLRAASAPLDAAQVIDALHQGGTAVEGTEVHSGLYRLIKRGRIVATGNRGSRLYREANHRP